MDNTLAHNVISNQKSLHSELEKQLRLLVTVVHSDSSDNDKYEQSKSVFNKIIVGINEFEPSPKLLDSQLISYIELLSDLFMSLKNGNDSLSKSLCDHITSKIGEVVYNFSKVRGFKHITNYFSSDVYLIPRLIDLTSKLENDNELFLCLIWLSNLLLVPFKLHNIDEHITLQLLEIGISNLAKHSNASKNQLISSILLSRLLTRADIMETNLLHDYFESYVEPEWKSLERLNGSVKLGHLMTINKIMKRFDQIDPISPLVSKLISVDLMNLRLQQNSSTKHLNNLNVLYMIKILSKLSIYHAKKQHWKEVSKIINQLLDDIMNSMTGFDTSLRYATAKALANLTKEISFHAINFQEQLIRYIIKLLDVPIKSDIFNCNLEINGDAISIPRYHTFLLYFGFCALNKCISNHLVPSILSVIHKTLFVEQRRLSSTIGSQIRDSSCFVVWALCRMLKPKELVSMNNNYMMETILLDLMLVIIMDDELIVRRCGLAVIQEYVGRFGVSLFERYFSDGQKTGEFIIKFIELLNTSPLNSTASSYNLIEDLIQMGFSRDLYIPRLLDNALNSDLKFETRKLSVFHLGNIMDQEGVCPIDFEVGNFRVYDSRQIMDILVDSSLYISCEFLYKTAIEGSQTSLFDEYHQAISDRNREFTFDYHHDTHEKAEGYLKWTNLMLTNHQSIDEHWDHLFNIIRMTPTSDLITEFETLLELLSRNNIVFNDEQINNFQHYLRNNNTILSKVIFTYQNYDEKTLNEFIQILSSKEVDCEIRSNMINNFKQKIIGFNSNIANNLVELLDDYTITKQGDVGSKVRLGIIRLINASLDIFRRHKLFEVIKIKLIRLAGELIDRIRLEAMTLLLKVSGEEPNNVAELSMGEFYQQLLSYYQRNILNNYQDSAINKELSLSFWRGFSFSVGSMTASSTVLNESFNQLLLFFDGISQDLQLIVFQNLFTLLKSAPSQQDNSRDQKCVLVVLNLLVKVFESNFQFPPNLNFEPLYIRCYNLQIGTTNTTRISLSLRILYFLTAVPASGLRTKSVNRILALALTHKINKVRQMAGELLFEICNDSESRDESHINLLETIDWEQPPSTLKQFKATLESVFITN